MTAVSVVSQGWQTYQKPPDLADSIICTCKWRPSCLLWTNHCFPPIPDQSPGEERQAPVLLVPGWALCWVCMNAVTTATGRLTTDIFFLNLIHPLTVLNLFHWFHVLNRRAWPPHASRVKLNVAERHLSKHRNGNPIWPTARSDMLPNTRIRSESRSFYKTFIKKKKKQPSHH